MKKNISAVIQLVITVLRHFFYKANWRFFVRRSIFFEQLLSLEHLFLELSLNRSG